MMDEATTHRLVREYAVFAVGLLSKALALLAVRASVSCAATDPRASDPSSLKTSHLEWGANGHPIWGRPLWSVNVVAGSMPRT